MHERLKAEAGMRANACQLVGSPCCSAAGGSVGDAGRFLLLLLEGA